MRFFDQKTHRVVKFIAQIGLPALGTFYVTIAGIWGLPAAEEVLGTIVAIDTLLGILLQLSTSAYKASDRRYSGAVTISEQNENGLHDVNVSVPAGAQEILGKKELVLKVVSQEDRSRA